VCYYRSIRYQFVTPVGGRKVANLRFTVSSLIISPLTREEIHKPGDFLAGIQCSCS
jgi:hypothetical protein